MPQYAVLLYENVPPDQLPPDVQAAHLAMPERVTEAGGRILAGMALHESSTATAIRGELLTDGPFIETKEELAGVFVIEARDLDHAVELARMTPIVEGGVEVRPLIGFEVLEGP
ncbi:MAG TPA: YciI family protein [Acidimicrobiales bacterium]